MMRISRSYYSWISFPGCEAALHNICHKGRCWVSHEGWEPLFPWNAAIRFLFLQEQPSHSLWGTKFSPLDTDWRICQSGRLVPLRGNRWPKPGRSSLSVRSRVLKPCLKQGDQNIKNTGFMSILAARVVSCVLQRVLTPKQNKVSRLQTKKANKRFPKSSWNVYLKH